MFLLLIVKRVRFRKNDWVLEEKIEAVNGAADRGGRTIRLTVVEMMERLCNA